MDKEIFSKLKGLVSSNRQWDHFSNYLDVLIAQNHKVLEQSENMITVHKAQGAIEALDIQDAETRLKEEILKEQMEGLKTAGRTARDIAVESIPGVSEALAEKRVDEALQRGDTTGAMIEGAAGLMGAVPMVGDAAAQVVRKTKSPLRKLFDKLPKKEKEELPAQPDNNRLMGYHGTARERKSGEPFFDIGFARKNDQFLGEGFYFTLDPKIAEEYSNLRAFRDFDVSPIQKGKDPVLTHRETGQKTTVANLQKGLDADGNRLAMGQTISRFDLSNLEKPYIVRTQSDRKKLKQNFEEIKKEGYDSVLFADFKDRSKQIMVFPEHMEKIKSDVINFDEGGVVPMKRMAEQMELFEPVERGFEEGGLMEEGGMVDE
jgi:hypothetical protein